VLCGPGTNGGDGYVIARRLKEWGLVVQIVAPLTPKTPAAKDAKAAWGGPVLTSGGQVKGEVLVDCLFGSGLARPLTAEHALLLRDLAERHSLRIAVDVPSGIATDTGEPLNEKLPRFDVTLALGGWKFANCLAPARSFAGTQRLVPIGIAPVEGAAQRVTRPVLQAPKFTDHKYTRGQCAVVAGSMPGAALLSANAAMRAGAGYVKLLGPQVANALAGLVCDASPLAQVIADTRVRALLVGPGLGRHSEARAKLKAALSSKRPLVLDADALHLVDPSDLPGDVPIVATPHDGELDALCRRFAVIAEGRMAKAKVLSAASGMIVLAKGADSFVASPDGALAIGPAAPSWLSVAGSGDVLAGILVSRLATGRDAFKAAQESLWLHAEAARKCGAAFTADDLASAVSEAVAACL
ncbi:MAG: NAD(P)H-hydrate dehydratase, partial [Erythrobacter sp.]|nr:NAD(P)H-hydrate dehydratase [Erythrobacter sp.]